MIAIHVGVPLLTTPIRLGGLAGPALAGHPGTRLVGMVLGSVTSDASAGPAPPTAATWVPAAALPQVLAAITDAPLVLPLQALIERLGVTLPPHVIRAEDLCRLWGAPTWSVQASDLIASMVSDGVRRRVERYQQDLANRVRQVADLLTPTEVAAYQTHRRINARGMHIETALAAWLRHVIEQREQERQRALGAALHRQALSATEALRPGGPIDRLLRAEGLVLRNRSEEALVELIDSGSCSVAAAAVLQSLIGHGRMAKVKVDRIRASVSPDDRLREQFVMWAARTWRFSSRDVQLQNLPKPAVGTDYARLACAVPETLDATTLIRSADLDAIATAVPGGHIDDAFPAYTRMLFSAAPGRTLVIVDWNAIEPRIRAWLSDDAVHLEAWRSGRDLYSELISSIVGRVITKASDPHLRTVGKLADIGCGYHMGADSFASLCAANGVDLAGLGLTARRVVDQYRTTYHALADRQRGLWGQLEAGAIRAVMTGDAAVGRLRFARTADGHLDLILPNGSRRRWWKATVVMSSPPWAKPGDHRQDRPAVHVATSPDGVADQVMYGGRILENACQAIGRELLVVLMLELEERGYQVVAHCHDEIVLDVDMEVGALVLQEIRRLAETPPTWAEGLPLRAEGFVSPFWSKEPPC